MPLTLHVLVKERLAHKPGPADQTLVRFFIRVHKPVRVAVVATVERLAADLAQEGLLSGVYPSVLLEMLGVDERGVADVALEGPFARMCRLHVVVQQPAPLEPFAAVHADVALVVQMRGPFVRLQVGPLRKGGTAHLALVRPLPSVGALVVADLRLASESFVADGAHEGPVARVHDGVDFEVVRRTKPLATQMAAELFDPGVRPLVLYQVLLAQEGLGALVAGVGSRPDLVGLFVCFEGVFRGEIFAALLANVRSDSGVGVYMLFEQIPATVFLATRLACPRFVLGVVHASMDAKQTQITENAIADLALEIALFGGHVLVEVGRQLVPLPEVLNNNK